jgi:signal transduction histidine kinase
MATEPVDSAEQEMDLPTLCRAVADASPMPMAGLGGPIHTLRYVNLAFCLLIGKSKDELLGTAFSSIAHCPDECMLLLDRVAKTGLADSHTGQEHNGIHPLYWSYAMWPLLGANQNHLGIMVQVTEAAQFHQDAVAMNEALLLGSVKQHELREAADVLNVKLQAAIVLAQMTEKALLERATIAEENVALRLAVDELATSRAVLHSVLDSTSDNVITISHNWIMLYANRRALDSVPDFKLGADFWTCFPSVLGTSAEGSLRNAMTDRTDQQYDDVFTLYRRWFRVKAFPVPEGISVFFGDVTAEKNNQEQLAVEQLLREKRIEALTHMAAGLAHEISNPLAIIHGLASDLVQLAQTQTLVDPGEVRGGCERILKTADRASNILRGLRGFAREAAQDPMEPASIYEIIDQCIELQEARLKRHEVDVKLHIDAGMPVFLCREVQIGQILTNLLNNAFDAITQSNAAERWIAISVKSSHNEICVDVTDSGPGIEDHFKDHLMEPFFTTKVLGLGMGVGLSLSRAIAQDHGGSLNLLRDTQNTTFRLTLPLASADSKPYSLPSLSGVSV